jgi:hypothetical protein
MSSVSSILKIGEVVSTWLDPDKREKRVLRAAIEAATELLMILRKEGRYAQFTEKMLKEYEVHYQKRWNSWKDGT